MTARTPAEIEAAEVEAPVWTADQPMISGKCKCALPDVDLDAAAERAHNAMFYGELQASGIQRDLWRNVVRAVLGGAS